MSLSNRVELIPSWLLLVESAFCLVFLSLVALVGPTVPLLLIATLLVAYSFGAFDVLSLTRHQSRRAPFQAAGVVLFVYAITVAIRVIQDGPQSIDSRSIAATVTSVAVYLLFHAWLRQHFLSGAQHMTLTLPQELESQARALAHYVNLSGYPANVIVASDESETEPYVTVFNPRWDYSDEPIKVIETFDPARFCDVALRLLPSELVEMKPELLDNRSAGRSLYLLLKRVLDIAMAAVILGVTFPLWLFAAIGIQLSDGRPIFYTQIRVGHRGRPFRIVKFRTLRQVDSSPSTPTSGIEDRVYPFGTFLRRTRIDELPQLLMVLVGTMSLVGPRPEMLYFHRRSVATIPFYAYRLEARPGLTGWAQIRYAHSTTEAEYRDKTAYDLWYVAHRSIALDAKIMLRTLGTLLNRFGSK